MTQQQTTPHTGSTWPTPPGSVNWTPLEKNFTRRTLEWSGKVATPQLPTAAKALACGFSLFALPLLFAAFKLLEQASTGFAAAVLAVLGLVSAVLPTILIRMSKTITLDGTTGTYYTAQRGIDPVGRKHVEGVLSDIVALQVLDKRIRTTSDGLSDDFADVPTQFRTFELNLIMRDGARLHLLDEVDFWVIKRAAEQLSTMLSVPIWHKPGMRNYE